MNFGKKQSYEQQGNQVTLHYENQDVILTILKDDIIRVLVPCWMKDYKSKAIEGDKTVPANFTVEDAGDATVAPPDEDWLAHDVVLWHEAPIAAVG